MASLSPAGALAQSSEPGTVSGAGTVTLERPAQLMRVRVVLTAKDKQIADALTQLRQRKEAAAARLKEVGAAAESIRFSAAEIGAAGGGSQAQMQRMVMMRMQKKVDPKQLAAMPKVISTTLTADFPLSAAEPEALLLQVSELQDKIKAADVGESAKGETLSPEEEELMEEMEGMMDDYGMGDSSKPGEPSFTYIFQVSDQDRAKALSEAFTKARAQADQLAEAAGQALGDLRSLNSYAGGADDSEDRYSSYMAMMMMQQGAGSVGDHDNEAVGASAGRIVYRVGVNATFGLAGPR